MTNQRGAALLELVVAAVLCTIVMAAGVMILQAQNRVGLMITARTERNDAVRSAFAILRAELRHHSTSDFRAVGRDSVAARIFRGLATVCGFSAPDVFVRYSGLRLPDPAKDSALQVGPENTVAIQSVRVDTTACGAAASEQVLAVRWPAQPRVGASWLIFESGSYHLATNALRYRQGAATRQPVTTDVFDDSRSAFGVVADTIARAFDVTLHDRSLPASRYARHYLQNGR